PHIRVNVLELPEVVELAEQRAASIDAGLRRRLSFTAGDMFAEVPAADTYIVKTVMHNWDDERCQRLLGNCRARLQRNGRILGVDNVLPPLGDIGASGAKLLDILMMVSLLGRERTEAEWRALYRAAGLD